jgi:transposase
MSIKTILNRCHPIRYFVYGAARFVGEQIHVVVRPRVGSLGQCGACGGRGPTYDTARQPRRFEFVPLWGYVVFLVYRMRRIDCATCGVRTEQVPWADGKNRCCNVYRLFLARWARRVSWSEVALIFGVTWGVVNRAIRWVVAYGLVHRDLDRVTAIGVDEIAVWKGHKYLTVVYQLDQGRRRLLWVGKDRTKATIRAFFQMFGEGRAKALRFVASDMWKPYLDVIKHQAGQALHILDRFHVVAKLNKAVDEVRAKEARELARQGYEPILKHTRWCFLKRREKQTLDQRRKLKDVLHYDLRTVRAFLLKESFDAFWAYSSPTWAGWFLDKWCTRAMRSRLEPMKRFAKTLRRHRPLLLNWFAAKGEIALGVVEGMNTNAKLAIRKARGFRTYDVLETALYHELGRLPEPVFTHTFC